MGCLILCRTNSLFFRDWTNKHSVTPLWLSRYWSLLFRYLPFYFEIVTSCVGSSPLCDLPHLSSPVSLHLHLIPSSVCLYSLCAPLSCQCYSSASPFDLMVCSSFICSLCFHWFALCFSCYFVLLTHFLLFLHFFFFYRYIYIYISFSFWLMKCFYSSLVIVTRTLTLL